LAFQQLRLGRLAVALLLITGTAAAFAVTHMTSIPAYVMIAPGYVVQAWLFENHRALGGFGYQVTMVVVSALVWTVILLTPVIAVRLIRRAL